MVVAVPALLAFVWAVCRAALLSITFDEATTYNEFVRPGLIGRYSTNNHVLNSWLMKATTSLLGSSELSIRVPALLGAALYLVAIWGLATMVLPRWWERLAVVTLLSWNPLLLDFFSLARGYSLALGFLAMALLLLCDELRRDRSDGSTAPKVRNLILASICLSLSLCSNWSFLFIDGGLCLGFLGLRAVQSLAQRQELRRLLPSVALLTLPGGLAAGLILGPYVSGMSEERNFVGFPDSPLDSLRDVVNAIFFHAETTTRNLADFREYPILEVPRDQWQLWTMRTGVPMLVACAFILLLALLLFSFPLLTGRGGKRPPLAGQLAWLAGAALSLNWLTYDAAHYARDLHFPLDRLFLYVVPFFLIVVTSLAFGFLPAWTRVLGLVAILLVVGRSMSDADPRYFRSWQFNAGTRRFFDTMTMGAPAGDRVIHLCGPWVYATAFDYYRITRRAQWMSAYEKSPFPAVAHCDFFVYHPNDYREAQLGGFHVVAEDPASGTRLAERIER